MPVALQVQALRDALVRVELKSEARGGALKVKKYLKEVEMASNTLLDALDGLPEPRQGEGTSPGGQESSRGEEELEHLYGELLELLDPPAWALEPRAAPSKEESLQQDGPIDVPCTARRAEVEEDEDEDESDDGDVEGGEEEGDLTQDAAPSMAGGSGESWRAAEEAAAAAADAIARLMAENKSPSASEDGCSGGGEVPAAPSVSQSDEISSATRPATPVEVRKAMPVDGGPAHETTEFTVGGGLAEERQGDAGVAVRAVSPQSISPEEQDTAVYQRTPPRGAAPPHTRRDAASPRDPMQELLAALVEDYDAATKREWGLGAQVASLLGRARGQVALGSTDSLRSALRLFREAALEGSLLAARGMGLLYLCGLGSNAESVWDSLKRPPKGEGGAARVGPGGDAPSLAVGWGSGQQALAERWLRHAAERGDAVSARELAHGLEAEGRGAESVHWFRRAAELGCSSSAAEYAFMLENGAQDAVGASGGAGTLARDLGAAAEWYQKAVDGGCVWAQSNLARLLCEGEGPACDPVAGAALFRSAAEAGSELAANSLGVCFEEGVGVPQDLPQAALWYRLASERGSVEGALNLGHALAALGDSRGAEEAFAAAARQGSSEGLYCQGALLEGQTVGAGGGGSPPPEALELYRQAADAGDARALVRLAEAAWAQNHVDEALELYHRAAGAGCPEGFLALGWLAAEGEAGVERDPNAARECFLRAAHLGHNGAMAALSHFESAHRHLGAGREPAGRAPPLAASLP